MTRTAAAFLLVSFAAVVGCAGRKYDPQTQAGDVGPDSVYIETINENYYDARVHAIFGAGQRHPLGTIPGNGGRARTALAWQPQALVFEVTFIIDGRSYLSQPRDLGRGEVFELTLPANINQSGFFRRVTRS